MLGHMGRRRTAAILVACAGASAVLIVAAISAHGQDNKPSEAERTAALTAWDSIVTVLQHPRCMNCHQENYPLQGDERRIHIPLVVRGITQERGPCDDRGVGVNAMRCANCHNGGGNNETSGAPGGGGGLWSLAPARMAWQGLSSKEICNRLKDPERNKNPLTCKSRTGQDLIDHMDTEPLVRWAWDPIHNPARDLDRDPTKDPEPDPNRDFSNRREPMPMSHKDFVDQMKIWVTGGMACPD